MNILRTIGAIVAVLALVFAIAFGGLQFYRFFAPKYEGARREVFEATRSYNQAKMQELAKYRLEYLRADNPTEKEALASTIRHRFTGYNDKELPHELRTFLSELNN